MIKNKGDEQPGQKMSHTSIVHSFHRATGRSNLIVNLCALLASQGYRVGALDFDFQSPTLSLYIGLSRQAQRHSLNHYLWGQCDIQQAAYEMTEHLAIKAPGRLLVVPASPESEHMARMLREPYDVSLLNKALLDLSDIFTLDFLLVDSAPGLEEERLAEITLCDSLIVLTRPTPQDFQGTAVVMDVARNLKVPHVCVVLNYTPGGHNTADIQRQLQKAYRCQVGALLPYSDRMAAIAGRGILALQAPRDPYIVELQQLAGWLKSL